MPQLRAEQSTNGSPEASKSKRSKARVLIYRNEDGSYDTSSLSDDDKARFFGQSGPAAGPSVASSAAEPPPPPADPVDPAVIGLALNLLTSIEAAIVGSKLGIPQDRCLAALQPRPPVDQMVIGAATKVANKYGASLGPYSDEIALVAALAMWQIGAFTELRAIAAEMAATKPATPPPNADHGKHKSPDSKPATPAADAPKATTDPASKVVPIELLIGAHSKTGGGATSPNGF